MFFNKKNTEIEGELQSAIMPVYIKITNMGNHLNNFEPKRFFSEQGQKRLPEYFQESCEYQNLFAIREKFISCNNNWERVGYYNMLLMQIQKMQKLNYNAKEQKTLKELYKWITSDTQRLKKFNEQYKEYLIKNKLPGFAI